MNRNERRALAHKERKLSSKLARAAEASHPPVAAVATAASALDIREPGGVFPPLSAIAPTLAPVSDAQLAANRANSLKSSGPTTEAGRASSSQNRTTHGLTRHNGSFRLLTAEDPEKFAALKSALEAEHQPMTETESILVNNMAESHWLSKRAGSSSKPQPIPAQVPSQIRKCSTYICATKPPIPAPSTNLSTTS
jgi:hypothetical protein